jgi:hypothetical protein
VGIWLAAGRLHSSAASSAEANWTIALAGCGNDADVDNGTVPRPAKNAEPEEAVGGRTKSPKSAESSSSAWAEPLIPKPTGDGDDKAAAEKVENTLLPDVLKAAIRPSDELLCRSEKSDTIGPFI